MPEIAEAVPQGETVRQLDALERIGNSITERLGKLEDGLAMLPRVHLQALADRYDLNPRASSKELRSAIRWRLIGGRTR